MKLAGHRVRATPIVIVCESHSVLCFDDDGKFA
jgi:hypothetical protein